MLIFTLFGSFLLYNCRMFSSYNHNSISRVTRSSTGIILLTSYLTFIFKKNIDFSKIGGFRGL